MGSFFIKGPKRKGDFMRDDSKDNKGREICKIHISKFVAYADQPFKVIYVEYKYRTEDGSIGGSVYSDEEAMEKYKIRMISWEAAPPIENKFK